MPPLFRDKEFTNYRPCSNENAGEVGNFIGKELCSNQGEGFLLSVTRVMGVTNWTLPIP